MNSFIEKIGMDKVAHFGVGGLITANIYFNIDDIDGRAIIFEGKFDSIKEAKTKMYELLCKMKDDIDILRKMKRILDPDPDKFRYLTFDEMMNL